MYGRDPDSFSRAQRNASTGLSGNISVAISDPHICRSSFDLACSKYCLAASISVATRALIALWYAPFLRLVSPLAIIRSMVSRGLS